jgi:4-hydroxymandelate oxidase
MLLNLSDYEAAAAEALAPGVFDFVAGGAYDERTVARNRFAFEALTLNPRYIRDVSRRELETTVLGETISLPVFVSPAGLQDRVHPEGESATARGTGRSRTLMIVPSSAAERLPAVAAAASGPLWLQIYHRGRAETERLVRLAEEAGCTAICLTCDAPFPQPKERDLRNGYLVLEGGVRATALMHVTWGDVEWLRGITGLPIVLKGLNAPEDGRLAAESGVEGVLVSTHGGRLLDSTLSAIEYLPGVVDAVGGRLEVYLDSGVRRGGDVLKALALGARAVGIGRPFCWGLGVDGADGVHAVLEILRTELDVTLAFCGQTSVRDLEPGLVNRPPGWGAPSA